MTGPHLYLLGGFDFAGVGAAVPTLSRKARAMVAYLALQSGHAQSREKLAGLLWGVNGDAQARMSLRQAVSAVRKAMHASGGRFLTDGEKLALHLGELDFDVARFEALTVSTVPEDLERALVIYRGDLLGLKEEPFEDWLRVQRERLRAMAVAVLDRLVAHYSAANDPAACVPRQHGCLPWSRCGKTSIAP
ncbi:hypothetical protein [Mesorhizobium sp. M0579]|uniref:AfsR/SARP family transcriptional regulator n=1 Tax=Mesorhizobium sp. M0579 TaxID=2956962 RepID=UPI003335DD3F